MATNIPPFTLSRQYEIIKDEMETAVLKTLRSTHYVGGPQLEELERSLEHYAGTAHAIGCANGSDAILLACQALGLQPGDEIITTPFTFFATAGSPARLGCVPVFVDVRDDTYNINEQLLEEAITPRTKAIIVVHLFGQMCNMPAIMEIARRHDIPVIEDAAQAIGARYEDTSVGGFGLAATLSFYPTKNLGAAGDAGMILTNDERLARITRSLRAHGMGERYYHSYVGMNSRLDALQATVLNVKIKHLDEWTDRRRSIAAIYKELLQDVRQVILPAEDPSAYHVYHHFTIKASDRDGLQKHLQEKGIGTSLYYPVPLNRQECFADLGQHDNCPVADELASSVLSLPMFPELSDEEVKTVCEAIKEFYR